MLESYHILFLNGTGQVTRVIGRDCASHEDAIVWLDEHTRSYDCPLELWRSGRYFTTHMPDHESADDRFSALYGRALHTDD